MSGLSPAERVRDEEAPGHLDPRCDRRGRGQEGPRLRLIANEFESRSGLASAGPVSRRDPSRIAVPSEAAISDAARMPSFASSASAGVGANASFDTNSDTVKPMPPSAATPTTVAASACRRAATPMPSRHASQVNPRDARPACRRRGPRRSPCVTGDDAASSIESELMHDAGVREREDRARSRSCSTGAVGTRATRRRTPTRAPAPPSPARSRTVDTSASSSASTMSGCRNGRVGASRPSTTPAMVACNADFVHEHPHADPEHDVREQAANVEPPQHEHREDHAERAAARAPTRTTSE